MDLDRPGNQQWIDLEVNAGRWADRSRDAALVISALEEAGIDAKDFGHFVNNTRYFRPSSFDVVRALPVLLKWFPRVEDPAVKDTIASYLGCFAGAGGQIADELLKAFEQTPSSLWTTKWAVGDALSRVADPGLLDDLLRVVADRSHGKARQMIVYGLGKGTKDPRVVPALLSLLDDEDVALHAMSALRRKLGSAQVRPHIERLLGSSSASIRAQARRELRSIDRSLERKKRPR